MSKSQKFPVDLYGNQIGLGVGGAVIPFITSGSLYSISPGGTVIGSPGGRKCLKKATRPRLSKPSSGVVERGGMTAGAEKLLTHPSPATSIGVTNRRFRSTGMLIDPLAS